MPNPLPPQVSLRALREWRGMTLEELAQSIREQGVEITVVGINNAELGHRNASEPVMLAWCRALGIKRHLVRQARELREWVTTTDAPSETTPLEPAA